MSERIERVVIVTKPTALEELRRRHHSTDRIAFYLKTRGQSMEEYVAADAAIRKSVARVRQSVPEEMPCAMISRELISGYLFRPSDLVIAIGPDGLCVNVAKYLDGQPILGVNPDPARIDGVLARFRPDLAGLSLYKILAGKWTADHATLAKAVTNDGQSLYAMNDFLIGRRDIVSSRYTIVAGNKHERQSSSGVIVCTGVGSSGWMKSVATGAAAMTGSSLKERLPFPWDERSLLYAVREPFPTHSTGATLVFGKIRERETLVLSSEMPEGGVILSDGVVEDALEWNAGTTVTITLAEKTATILSPS